jgi:GT2 family glycosyltransferase
VDPRTQAITLCQDLDRLETDPNAFVSGCSLFFRTALAEELGFLPEDYFLYYEDPAFSLLLKRRGLAIAGTDSVVVQHIESLSTGRRSMLMEYYSKRNRWHFMQEFFPHRVGPNRWRLLYDLQSYLFRLRFRRAWVEWIAYLDFKHGITGPTTRPYSRFQLT